MKRSEFVATRHKHWMLPAEREGATVPFWVQNEVMKEVAAAEAAGVIWDSEEKPLPERLVLSDDGTAAGPPGAERPLDHVSFRVGDGSSWASTAERARVLAEAVRRYNAQPALREISDRLSRVAWGDGEDLEMIREALDAILDGKEPAS